MRDTYRRLPRRLAMPALMVAALAACQPQPSAPSGNAPSTRTARLTAATRPVDAIHVLRDRLLAHDGLGFAKLAVPPALFARLEQGWASGDSQWPLDELPLDARIPKMLAALQAPNADAALMTTFRRQFAGADRDINQAIRTLALFGGEYVATATEYSAEEREHISQAIAAASAWGLQAPFSDPARAKPFFSALAAAARRTGIDGSAGAEAYANLGMRQSLNRLSPFFATLLDQLKRQYGLDLDAAMRSVEASLMQQTGDSARLRLRYSLAGRDIDTVIPVVRIDGHWYLANYVARAEASLPAPPPAPAQPPEPAKPAATGASTAAPP